VGIVLLELTFAVQCTVLSSGGRPGEQLRRVLVYPTSSVVVDVVVAVVVEVVIDVAVVVEVAVVVAVVVAVLVAVVVVVAVVVIVVWLVTVVVAVVGSGSRATAASVQKTASEVSETGKLVGELTTPEVAYSTKALEEEREDWVKPAPGEALEGCEVTTESRNAPGMKLKLVDVEAVTLSVLGKK